MARDSEREGIVEEYSASNDIVEWLESMAGLLAHIRTQYGGVSELLEDPAWDASRSQYAVALLNGLTKDIARAAQEFKSHVHNYEKVV